jgi:hypothetical protein
VWCWHTLLLLLQEGWLLLLQLLKQLLLLQLPHQLLHAPHWLLAL